MATRQMKDGKPHFYNAHITLQRALIGNNEEHVQEGALEAFKSDLDSFDPDAIEVEILIDGDTFIKVRKDILELNAGEMAWQKFAYVLVKDYDLLMEEVEYLRFWFELDDETLMSMLYPDLPECLMCGHQAEVGETMERLMDNDFCEKCAPKLGQVADLILRYFDVINITLNGKDLKLNRDTVYAVIVYKLAAEHGITVTEKLVEEVLDSGDFEGI